MTLAERLRTALAAENPETRLLLSGDFDEHEAPPARSPAAVLVAVTDRPEPGLILTQRNANLRNHPGQVAFPGGRIDPGDDGPVAAALREAREEIGLVPDAVDVIGLSDPYRTGSGYHITPVVGIVAPDLPFYPAEAEVADVFEVPFAYVLDSANQVAMSAMWQGRERHFYEIVWRDRRIWGATAAMLVNLSRRLQWTA